MKNFKTLLESIQVLLEVKSNVLLSQWQEQFFHDNNIKDYKSLSDELKQELSLYIKEQQKLLDDSFNHFDISLQTWVLGVFKNKEQKFPEDIQKLASMMETFTSLKVSDKLSSEEKNLANKGFKYMSELLSSKVDSGLVTNYGNNDIIYDKGGWKVVKLSDYKESLVLIGDNRNSWCIKERMHFDDYHAPFFAFFKNDKPYALFHQKSLQLKDVNDFSFKEIDDEFGKLVDYLIFNYLKVEHFGGRIGDLSALFIHNPSRYKKLFNLRAISQEAKSKQDARLLYSIDGRDLNFTDRHNLRMATLFGDTKKAIDLLDNGVEHEVDENFGINSVLYAVQHGHLEILQKSIEKGMDINALYPNKTMLGQACSYDQPKIVKYLLGLKGIDINKKNRYGLTAALECMESSNYKNCLGLLLNDSRFDINVCDKSGWNLLFYVVRYDNIELMKELMGYRFDVDVNKLDNFGKSLLIIAIDKESYMMVELLLGIKGIDVNIRGKGCNIPLFRALSKDCDAINEDEYSSDEQKIYQDLTGLLLKDSKLNVNIKGDDGETALIAACKSSSVKLVKKLLTHYSIDTNIQDDDGKSALLHSSENGDSDSVVELLRHRKTDINLRDDDGDTALMNSCRGSDDRMVELLMGYQSLDVNLKNKRGMTALTISIENNEIECVKELCKHPLLDINMVDKYSLSPLQHACIEEHVNNSIVRALLEVKGIDVNYRNEDGNTALHYVKGDDKLTELLKQHGAKE